PMVMLPAALSAAIVLPAGNSSAGSSVSVGLEAGGADVVGVVSGSLSPPQAARARAVIAVMAVSPASRVRIVSPLAVDRCVELCIGWCPYRRPAGDVAGRTSVRKDLREEVLRAVGAGVCEEGLGRR